MKSILEWLWPPPSLDAALWGRMPRALVEWMLVTYVAPHNYRTVRLCSKTLRQMCVPLYERLREKQLQCVIQIDKAYVHSYILYGEHSQVFGSRRDHRLVLVGRKMVMSETPELSFWERASWRTCSKSICFYW
jgi:hypothetical protein